ncbi:MAG: ribosome recycling factor [Patescibacteria group bacterium]|nr:ribosome recycling factor [Patescibacteria group bacterium]
MHNLIESNKINFEKSLEFLKHEISAIRTGRVSPSLVEKIPVESYGTFSELMHVASISSPEPQTIVIKPWDKGLIKAIEKAISQSDLNINPVAESDLLRLNFPPLTEESRLNLVKILAKKLEEGRVAIKGQREKVRELVNKAEKDKEISEDEKFKALEDLDNLTKDYNEKIKQLGEQKEKEIMTI